MSTETYFVIQIGSTFFRTFQGKDLHLGTIDTAPLFMAQRFQNTSGAEVAAELIRANDTVKDDVSIREVGLLIQKSE